MCEIKGVSVLDGARFACSCSGACCGGYLYGPVEDEIARRIENHRFVENADRIYPEGPFEKGEIHGESVRVLRRIDGQCVFLAPDKRCVIHKELGFEAKPAMCRIYPLNVTLAPDGIAYISLNMECDGFAQGCKGPLLESQIEADLEMLVEQATLFVPEILHPKIGEKTSFDSYLERFEGPWLERLESDAAAPWLPQMIADIGGEMSGDMLADRNEILNKIDELCSFEAQKSESERDPVDAKLNRLVLDAVARLRRSAVSGLLLDQTVIKAELQNAVFGKAFLRANSLLSALGFEAIKLDLAAQLLPELSESARALACVNRCLRFSTLANLDVDAECERYAVKWARML